MTSTNTPTAVDGPDVPLTGRPVRPTYRDDMCLASFGGYGACIEWVGHAGDCRDAFGYRFDGRRRLTEDAPLRRGDRVPAPCSTCCADPGARCGHWVRSASRAGVVLRCRCCGRDALWSTVHALALRNGK